MDEREKDLIELRNYGHKLLEEMRNPDIISMLQETISHISKIAEEYSAESVKWHSKYDECAEQKKNLQNKITDLPRAWEQENQKLRAVIDGQAEKIENMNSDFAKKMEELRTQRNQEIDDYNRKLQALINTQKTLDDLKNEFEEKNRKLKEDLQRCNEEKKLFEDNQDKINGYDNLYQEKLEAQKKIDDANHTAAEWERKYGEEYNLRMKREKEIESLKNQLQSNADTSQSTENQPEKFSEMHGEQANEVSEPQDEPSRDNY